MSQTPVNFADEKGVQRELLGWFPLIALIVATVVITTYVLAFKQLPWNGKPEAWGQFGDFVGGLLNPLISLLTLSVAVKVWQLQKVELRETHKALEEQVKTAEQQRAEARFFDLLNVYQMTLGSLSKTVLGGQGASGSSAYGVAVIGRSALQHLFSTSIKRYFLGVGTAPSSLDDEASHWKSAIKNWQKESEQIDHYFRTVFMVLREDVSRPTQPRGVGAFGFQHAVRRRGQKDGKFGREVRHLEAPAKKSFTPGS